MSGIKFMPNDTGQLINVSRKNPEWGYVRLASEDTSIDNATGFIRTNKKSFLIKDKVENLGKFLEMYPGGTMPGKLINVEFVESEAPAEFKKLLNKNLSYEDSIAQYVKRAGAGGPELTLGGERILRYTKYSPTNDAFDTIVAHDNVEEVAEWNASKTASGANFAG